MDPLSQIHSMQRSHLLERKAHHVPKRRLLFDEYSSLGRTKGEFRCTLSRVICDFTPDMLENVTWRRGCFLSPSLPQKHKDEGDKGRESRDY